MKRIGAFLFPALFFALLWCSPWLWSIVVDGWGNAYATPFIVTGFILGVALALGTIACWEGRS